MKCDQCEMLSINGVPCHERSCPNMGARWDGDSWIKQRECFECGCTVDADDPCCSAEPESDPRHWLTTSSGRIELEIARDDAQSAAHQGRCDDDVGALSDAPYIRAQLDAIGPEVLAEELKEYGAWDAAELADHDQNLQRILWLACCEIAEEVRAH